MPTEKWSRKMTPAEVQGETLCNPTRRGTQATRPDLDLSSLFRMPLSDGSSCDDRVSSRSAPGRRPPSLPKVRGRAATCLLSTHPRARRFAGLS
jgi:hypothetical protein